MSDELEDDSRRPRDLQPNEVKVVALMEGHDTTAPPDGPVLGYVVVLRDLRGRRLLIHIGAFETMAIQEGLKDEASERPLTHDLLRNTIERLGATVEKIVIDDLWNGTYYARVFLARETAPVELDARPSDAIALALRTRAPIFVAEEVLRSATQEESLE